MSKNKREKLFPLTGNRKKGNEQLILELLHIMAWLRGPAGCPWDRAQTKQSLKKFLLEEAYEVLESIEENNPEKLKEELGDLLLQIIFISRLAEEKEEFNFMDIVRTLTAKLLRRHPHVFHPAGDLPAEMNTPESPAAVAKLWQEIKKSEKKTSSRSSILDGLPLSLPALERAQRLSEKAAQVGFDWPNIQEVWEKVNEEIAELKEAEKRSSLTRIKEEFGDLLFTLTNWARFKGFSAEEALRQANLRFAQRFQKMEAALHKKKAKWEDLDLPSLDELWKRVKKTKK